MNNSFLNYVDNRKGERLIQGILLFLLENDREFKQAFCDWVDWEPFLNIQEEYSEGEQRHDIVFFYKNSKKIIELKFWADWTCNQRKTPGVIDLIILPKARLDEAKKIFCKSIIRSWEQMEEKIVNSSNIAKVLLSGLNQYYWSSSSLENYEEYDMVMNLALKPFEYEDDFFSKFASQININNLSVGIISSSLKAWKSFFIKNSHLGDSWLNYLWFGLMINAERWNKDKSIESHLVLQVCSGEFALKFSNLETLPNYLGSIGHNKGIIVKPDSKGKYSIENTWTQCEKLITQYSHLGPNDS